ncbi:Nn.00g080280.m01.CDS01 [Neocucurbitaria sp. VM-36]
MPIHDDFQAPTSAQALPLLDGPNTKFFVLFLSSIDSATKQPWCSDVRAALPLLDATFSAEDSPEVHYVYVGQKPEYKSPDNLYRTKWNINSIPTLARYERIGNEVKETSRLVEVELLDKKQIYDLIKT